MNTLNIILLSCSVAVTIAQKVGDTSNDIIDGQRRNTGGYGLLRPGSQGGYSQGGYNQGGYNQGGYSQGGYNQGGYNQGYNGYNGGHGGASGGYGQGYGGYQGYGGNQGYGGGNQGYGGSAQGFGAYPGAGYGGYPSGFGGIGGYGGNSGVGGYPSGFGQGYPGYGGIGSGNRPNSFKPGFNYNRPEFPELAFPGRNPYRPASTPYNYHTGTYPVGLEDGYRYSDNVNRYLGRKAGEIKEGEEKS